MKYIALCIIVIVITACTTVTPIEMSPSEIQVHSNQGELDLSNKTIIVTTKDKPPMEALVLSTNEDSIVTNKGEILFSDIVKLDVKKISKGKTAAAAGGIYIGTGILGALILINSIDWL